MTESTQVTVTCRHGSYPGRRIGRVAAYEFEWLAFPPAEIEPLRDTPLEGD